MSDIKTRAPIVWLANESGHDYEPAKRFSETIKPLTIGNVNILHIDRLAAELTKGIVRYTQPEDFFLVSGTPMISGIAVPLWLTFHGQIRVLQWNAKQRDYELATITKDQLSRLVEKELVRG